MPERIFVYCGLPSEIFVLSLYSPTYFESPAPHTNMLEAPTFNVKVVTIKSSNFIIVQTTAREEEQLGI
jgi:hypothetical protein